MLLYRNTIFLTIMFRWLIQLHTYVYIHLRIPIHHIYCCTPCVVSFIRLVWLVIIIMYYVWTWLIVFGFAALGYRRAYICIMRARIYNTHTLYIPTCLWKKLFAVLNVFCSRLSSWCTTQHNTYNQMANLCFSLGTINQNISINWFIYMPSKFRSIWFNYCIYTTAKLH